MPGMRIPEELEEIVERLKVEFSAEREALPVAMVQQLEKLSTAERDQAHFRAFAS